jgi:pSer/pThr/pTyr-binding forkhead associated (FHA) protein
VFPKVILTATHGDLKGREFAFDGPATCVVGRCVDCAIRLPGDDWTVSRHHCLLEVDPPLLRVQDLGSLNSTYVNGEMVGQRDLALSPAGAARLAQPVRELLDGDELRVGNTRFHVAVLLTEPEGAELLPAVGTEGPDGSPEVGAHLCVPVL